jgi:hypothetical protein
MVRCRIGCAYKWLILRGNAFVMHALTLPSLFHRLQYEPLVGLLSKTCYRNANDGHGSGVVAHIMHHTVTTKVKADTLS